MHSTFWQFQKDKDFFDFPGKLISQVPEQLILKFTKPGDVILDPFLGSGTTALVAKKLHRQFLGVEIEEKNFQIAQKRIGRNKNIILADSQKKQIQKFIKQGLKKLNRTSVQFLLLHPPYFNIINFGPHPQNLSNAPTLQKFLQKFNHVLSNFLPLLQPNHFSAVIIADIKQKREFIPLSFEILKICQKHPLKLINIVVKNLPSRQTKIQKNLWSHRLQKSPFFLLNHEYIFIFQKNAEK